MRNSLLSLIFISLSFGLQAQEETVISKTSFLSIDGGVSFLINNEFSPDTRNGDSPSSYYSAVLSGKRKNLRINFGKKLKEKLFLLAQVDYNLRSTEVYCVCRYCLKIAPIVSEEKIHQVGIGTGVRWMLRDKDKFDIAIDGLTGVKLDINQNASIPWFVSVSPVFNYSFNEKHAISLKAGFSAHILGYSEYSNTNTLGYQYSF